MHRNSLFVIVFISLIGCVGGASTDTVTPTGGDDGPAGDEEGVSAGDEAVSGGDTDTGDADVVPGDDVAPGDSLPGGDDVAPGDSVPEGDDVAPAGDADQPEHLAVNRAYFILQASDLRRPDFPVGFTGFQLFVCNPALSAAEVQQVRDAIPGARLLAYTNVQDIQINKFTSAYYQQLEAYFDESLALHDLDTGEIIKLYDPDPENPQRATPSWIVFEESAEALVSFHKDITMSVPWDGIYVDMSTAVFPNYRLNRLQVITDNFDIDADGVADTVDDLKAQYAAWRPYFSQRLREELGSDVVIIGNTGGPLVDPAYNGITIEGVGTRFSVLLSLAYFQNQYDVSVEPRVSVAWVTTDEGITPSVNVARAMDWVVLGQLTYGPTLPTDGLAP